MSGRFQVVRSMVLALGMAAAYAYAAPTLQVNARGDLSGATGVNVNGSLYDVTFVDGSCFGVFGLCNSSSSFTFRSAADATAASNALKNLVFLNGPFGNFDTDPGKTAGIGHGNAYSSIVTPFGITSSRVDIFFFPERGQ